MNFWEWLKGPDINKGVEECRSTSGALLIDVRGPQEYRMGHIPGSKNIPLDSLDKISLTAASKETPLYVYCQGGSRSRRAASVLRRMGYSNVKDLGGIVSWNGKRE